MFRYKLKAIDSDKVTHQKELADDVENPWVDKMPFHGHHDDIPAVLDEEGNELEPAKPKNYEVIKEDISQEVADAAAKAQAKLDAAARLRARAGNAPVSSADFDDLLLALGLK